MNYNVITGKKRLTTEEYNQLSDEEKKKFKGMFFDEAFNPGDGDDIDYSYSITQAGLSVGVIDTFVEHHRRFNIEFHEHESQEIKKKNSIYFKKKWKLDQSEVITFNIGTIKRAFYRQSLIDLNYKISAENQLVYHDLEVFELIADELKKFTNEDVYIDVGACVGDTAMWIEKGTCFALEPSTRGYNWLLKNREINRVNLVPLKMAVSNKVEGYRSIEGSHYGLDSIIPDESSPTKTLLLDDVFKHIPNIKLIKIDCEGTDIEVLEGVKEIIKKNKPVVIIEVEHIDKNKVREIFNELDYNIEEKGISFIGRLK